jgi:hypothetical protein
MLPLVMVSWPRSCHYSCSPTLLSYVGLPVTTMVLIVLLTVHLTAGMHSCLSAGNASNLCVTSCLTVFTLEDKGIYVLDNHIEHLQLCGVCI